MLDGGGSEGHGGYSRVGLGAQGDIHTSWKFGAKVWLDAPGFPVGEEFHRIALGPKRQHPVTDEIVLLLRLDRLYTARVPKFYVETQVKLEALKQLQASHGQMGLQVG